MVQRTLLVALGFQGDRDDASSVAQELLRSRDMISDPWEWVMTQGNCVGSLCNGGVLSTDDAGALAEQTITLARQLGNPTVLMIALLTRGLVDSMRDPATAIPSLEEGLQVADHGGSGPSTVMLGLLSRCYGVVGDTTRAVATIRRGLSYVRDTGSAGLLVAVLDYAGQSLVNLGHDEPGTVLMAAALHGRISPRANRGHQMACQQQAESLAATRLSGPTYDRAVARGAGLSADDAIAYTLAVLDQLPTRPSFAD